MKFLNFFFLIACIISAIEFVTYCMGIFNPDAFSIGADMFNTVILFLLLSFAKFGVDE